MNIRVAPLESQSRGLSCGGTFTNIQYSYQSSGHSNTGGAFYISSGLVACWNGFERVADEVATHNDHVTGY